MVQLNTKQSRRIVGSSSRLLTWSGRFMYIFMLTLTFAILTTLFDIDAPDHNNHIDLQEIHKKVLNRKSAQERSTDRKQQTITYLEQQQIHEVQILEPNKELSLAQEGDFANDKGKDNLRVQNMTSQAQLVVDTADTIINATAEAENVRSLEHSNDNQHAVPVVAYIVTVTDCGTDKDGKNVPFPITEGAAVLQYSIARASLHGEIGGKYDYRLYAFYHPQAQQCVHLLAELGYTLIMRETPVEVSEIKGAFLRERIAKSGCCGEKELLKLDAFTLTHHPIVVLLDLDTIVLKPLDPLYDFLLLDVPLPADYIQWKNQVNTSAKDISLLYTIDYAMVSPSRKPIKPVQGGFLVLRPNVTIYNDLLNVVRKGDYRDNGGWGGVSRKFWGGMTVQGLIPYYFLILHPGHALELNRCVFNNMCSNHREKVKSDVNDKNSDTTMLGECFTQETDCEDCRARPVDDIFMAHYTICQKPWLCHRHNQDGPAHKLCRALHHEWFRLRSEMEESWGRSGSGTSNDWADADLFYGYCSKFGHGGYQLISRPYGK